MSVTVGAYEVVGEVPAVAGPWSRVLLATRRGVLGFEKHVLLHVLGEGADEATLVARAQRASRLSHGGIARVLGTGRAALDGAERVYVVTELPRGAPLAGLVERLGRLDRRMPAAVGAALVAALAEALDHAHRRGAAHGALAAPAVYVDPEGACVIAAFGLTADGTPERDLLALAGMLESLPLESDQRVTGVVEQVRSRGIGSAGDLCDALLALAFTLSPAPSGRSAGAWLRASGLVGDALEQQPSKVALLRLSGPPEAVRAELELVTRDGGSAARDGLAAFTRDGGPDVDRALDAALAAVASGQLAASVRLSSWPAEDPAPAGVLSDVPVGRVHVSAEAASRARPSFVISPLAGSTDVFLAAGERVVVGGGRFVGRTKELGVLGAALHDATVRGPARRRVVGPAGMGKTRLLGEVARRARRVCPHVALVRCGRGAARGPLGSLRSLVTELQLDDPADAELELGPARLVGLLERRAAEGPVLLCLDDVHLADPESVAALEATFSALAPGTRLLLIESLTEEHAAATGQVALGELPDEDVAQLLAARLGARLVPPELFEAVVARAGGHPLFVEEVVRRLVDDALVEVRHGVARLRDGAAVSLPGTLASLATARLARLEGSSVRVVAAAAILGAAAPPRVVAAVAGLPPGSESEVTWQIVEGGFGRADEAGGLHLSAVHAEAVCSLLGADAVRALHAAAATAFAGGVTPEELVARAGHLERSAGPEDAARAWLRAARAQAAAGAREVAGGLYVRALGGLTDAAELHAAVAELAELAREHGLQVDLEDVIDRAMGAADAGASERERALFRVRAARLLPGAPAMALVLLDAAESAGPLERGEIDAARVSVARGAGLPQRGHEAARAVVRGGGDDPGAMLDAATIALWADDLELARAALARLGDDAAAERLRAELSLAEGREGDAGPRLEAAVRRARAASDGRELARAALAHADLLRRRGDAARAYAAASEALRSARAAGLLEIAEVAAATLDALEVASDLAARDRLTARCAAARARGWTWGELSVRLIREDVAEPSDRGSTLTADADAVGHAAVARRARAAASARTS